MPIKSIRPTSLGTPINLRPTTASSDTSDYCFGLITPKANAKEYIARSPQSTIKKNAVAEIIGASTPKTGIPLLWMSNPSRSAITEQ